MQDCKNGWGYYFRCLDEDKKLEKGINIQNAKKKDDELDEDDIVKYKDRRKNEGTITDEVVRNVEDGDVKYEVMKL